ncbi:MAG TPA: GAF domain-containing protein [Anaeromyxobacter sp.]|nr:GAF domain-containing protein [Anaeromyxobacter sp.]
MGEPPLPAAADVRLARLSRLQELTAELSAAATPQEVARIIFERGLSLVGARVVTLYWERTPGQMELVHGLGVSEEFVQRYRRIDAGTPIPSGEVYRTGQAVWLGNPDALARHFPLAAELAAEEGIAAWAAIPLVIERSRGSLGLRFDTPREFSAEERDFLQAVARQCAQALERAQLYEAQRRLADRIASLQAITSELSAALTPREVAAVLLRHLLGLGARGGVVLAPGTDGRLAPLYAHEAEELQDAFAATPSPGAAAPRWLEDEAAVASALPGLVPLWSRRADGAWGIVPLRMEGRDVGGLAVAFPPDRVPGADDRTFVAALAQQGAQALERARLYDAQRLQAKRLGDLHAATAALSGAVTPAEVATAALAAVGVLGARAVEIHAFVAPDRLAVVAGQGAPSDVAPAADPAAEVIQSGRALWIESREELTSRYPELAAARPEAAFAAVPLLSGGRPGGVLVVAFAGPRHLDADERLYLRMLAMPCAQALERTRLTDAAAQEHRAAEWFAALLEGALAAVPVGFALLDGEGRVIRTSERFARLAGAAAEAHRNRTPAELFPGFPGAALDEGFRRMVASGERVDLEISGETAAAAGTSRRFVITWFPVRVAGEVVGAGIMVREVGLVP